MLAQTSWASEAPAVNHTASLEIEDAKSARDALDSNEICGSGLPSIVGNSAALRGARTTRSQANLQEWRRNSLSQMGHSIACCSCEWLAQSVPCQILSLR